jgi:hypothetical protein
MIKIIKQKEMYIREMMHEYYRVLIDGNHVAVITKSENVWHWYKLDNHLNADAIILSEEQVSQLNSFIQSIAEEV